jgi:hypothetical protein
MLHYHIIKNTPGYMPWSDEAPYAYSRFADAKSALIDELKRDEDSYAMEDDEDMAEACCHAAEDVNLWSSPDVAYVVTERPHDLGIAYSVTECTETECTDDEENTDAILVTMVGGYSYSMGEPEAFPTYRAACEAWADRHSSNGLRLVDGVYWPTWGDMADDDYAIATEYEGLTRDQVQAIADGAPCQWDGDVDTFEG